MLGEKKEELDFLPNKWNQSATTTEPICGKNSQIIAQDLSVRIIMVVLIFLNIEKMVRTQFDFMKTANFNNYRMKPN